MHCKKALTALKNENSTSHTENMLNSMGELFIIEIGTRMRGYMIASDLIHLSTGYNFVLGVVDLSLGKFQVPIFSFTKYAGIYLYTLLTKSVKIFIINNDYNIHIVEKQIDNNPLEDTNSNSQHNVFFIYQGNLKFLLEES